MIDGAKVRQDFLFEPEYVPLNHGSYGVFPRAVQKVQREYQDKTEAFPDRWMRLEMYPELRKSRELIAGLLHCPADDLIFCYNASSAANIILRNFPFNEGDKVLYYTQGYVNVNSTLEYVRDTKKIELVPVHLEFPLSHEEIVAATKEKLEEHKDIRLAVYDLISSLPGAVMPYEELQRLFKSKNIVTVADGAHVVGQIPVNLETLDPDFFFTNCHKWLFVPRGFAALYVKKSHQGALHPQTVNSFYVNHTNASDFSSFEKEFASPGTIDHSNYFCVEAALAYRESLGGEEAIMKHNHDLAVQGGALMAKILGTQVMENEQGTLTASMVNVELPITTPAGVSDADFGRQIMTKLVYDHHVMVSPFKNSGKWWMRACAQVYLTIDDFKKGAHAAAKVCQELRKD
ncbi:PLP-dependent transferase [Hesseltinella vesiculosa]|uniref:PLP-dependent transferase n=1 Tax=Hesseltinella vesiculosa TaxID=101127 RepID=A0A1X2GW34_9FUNG|nr:PLP-dependent transferase [Hesseltinella vesiculosa]